MSTAEIVVLVLAVIAVILVVWNLVAPRHGKLDVAILLLAIAVIVPLFLK